VRAQAAITEILLTFFIMAIMALLIVWLPKIIQTTLRMLALASAEVVARDLAGLLSVSGSAPGGIEVEHDPPGEMSYDLEIVHQEVRVRLGKEVGTAETWLNLTLALEGVSSFKVTKTPEDEYRLEAMEHD
jgi:hypothetical protein